MKGIILAGGSGTRLYPLTSVTSKQLLPVYDKPMIYYPLSTLMLAGIRDILIISTPHDLPNFERLLGDNIFYGNGLSKQLKEAVRFAEQGESSVFGYYVDDPERFGVIEFDRDGRAISIEEKPAEPKSNYAVTGLYFYDNRVVDFAKQVRPSARGELEITDLNRMYLEDGTLRVTTLGRGYAWLDTGTMESLYEAAEFVRSVERSQSLPISVPEEIAYEHDWISKDALIEAARAYGKSNYGKHLQQVADERVMLNRRSH